MSFFRSRSTIQQWIDEFDRLHYPLAGRIRVLEQDSSRGDNTGLVVVQSESSVLDIAVQPREIGSPWWVVTFDTREDPPALNPADVMTLAAELTTISALCAFLEAKSSAYLIDDEQPPADDEPPPR